MTPADRVLARVRAVAGPGAIVEAYGSSGYAPDHASEVDILVSGDEPDRIAAALGLTRIYTQPPHMHGKLEGRDVDITVVNGDDDRAERMRSGPRDAAAIAGYLRTHARDAAFQAAWPHVRQFVRARALGHNGLGWFGSFGWALLLAIPLVTDDDMRAVAPGAAFPAWVRWLAKLSPGARVGFDATRAGEEEAFFLVAPSPPTRDVARLSRKAATAFFAEARAALVAIGDTSTDGEAMARIKDIALEPPPGATLVIAGTEEHSRGRYDGQARGLLRELEQLCTTRSWGRFDTDEDGSWQHRITVAAPKRKAARELAQRWLALANIDAEVD
ncbi:hypothetical protein BH11MYX1_BH11MYX1_09020 [soil metagenome]